jgi:hypothetical protein
MSEPSGGDKALGAILVTIAVSALVVSMAMNASFGWTQASTTQHRALMAARDLIIDPAAVGAAAAASRFFGRRQPWQGAIVLIGALGFMAWSIVNVFGFMSDRIAISDGHKATLTAQREYIDWVKGQTVNFDRPKAERQAMAAEVRDATQKLAEASATVPDAQAAAIAEMLGTTVENVQRAMVMIGSGVLQVIKLVCMFFGVSLWQPNRKSQMGQQNDAGSASNSNVVPNGNGCGNVVPFGTRSAKTDDKSMKSHLEPRPIWNEIGADNSVNHRNAANDIDAQEATSSGPGVPFATAPEPSVPFATSAEPSTICSVPNGTSGGNVVPFGNGSAKTADKSAPSHLGQRDFNLQPGCKLKHDRTICSVPIVPNGTKATKAAPLLDLQQLMAERGESPAQQILAMRWRVPKSTVSRWVRQWRADNRAETEAVFASVHPAGQA